MNRHMIWSMLIVAGCASVQADDEFDKVASWSTPDAETVKKHLDEWVDGQQADELMRAKVDALWTIEDKDADTPESLHARIQVQEHIAYPEALNMLKAGNLKRDGRRLDRT